MADLTAMMQAAAGAAGGENLYIEDVFSTYLYTGTGAAQTITNDIDLDGEGGLVWIKSRSAATNHFLFDTERGVTDEINSNTTDAEASLANSLTAFNSDGFSISSATGIGVSAATYASWTFRKAPKFFDVVTYTGTGANRTVAHNLGSVPGCIIVKRTDSTGDWIVYHRANTANPETDYLELNDTAATADDNTMWNDTAPTSTEFTVGTDADVNGSTNTYVAYLFAHDAGGFGDDGSENVITCGSYTGNGSADGPTITLGWEPQWMLYRNVNTTAQWRLVDNMRGWGQTTRDGLFANSSGAEDTTSPLIVESTATGFKLRDSNAQINGNGQTHIYIAIRRGPMKTPTAGTEVFAPVVRSGNETANTFVSSNITPDLTIINRRTNFPGRFYDRLRGTNKVLNSWSASAETTNSSALTGFDFINGYEVGSEPSVNEIGTNNFVDYSFRRAPGFFDVVCYTGTGSATTVTHNLGVVPELMIIKNRSQADAWAVYAGDNTDYLVLNTTAATADLNTYWNDTSPTSTNFTVGTVHNTNASAENYVAYLFASLAGVSKVGSYTGNGTSVSVTTGFQPRFILVKRTDSTGNWIVGDSARGLVAGDDPFLLLNSTAAETTNQDWVDVSATGFTVNETAANANVSTATYLYLAIS